MCWIVLPDEPFHMTPFSCKMALLLYALHDLYMNIDEIWLIKMTLSLLQFKSRYTFHLFSWTCSKKHMRGRMYVEIILQIVTFLGCWSLWHCWGARQLPTGGWILLPRELEDLGLNQATQVKSSELLVMSLNLGFKSKLEMHWFSFA
jgi:hypothetical protein